MMSHVRVSRSENSYWSASAPSTIRTKASTANE